MRRVASSTAPTDLRKLAADLAKQLGGHPLGDGVMCRCPAHDDRHPSLSIRVGRKALLFKCFAGCDTRDVLRALRGIDDRVFDNAAEPVADRAGIARELALRERAREIWDCSCALEGTRAADYLAGRFVASPSAALRFNPLTPLGSRSDVTYRPALIAALHDAGRLVAVQRCFLDGTSGSLARDLVNPRRLLGRPHGGAVILSPATDELALAEGVETAMSAAILLDIPVWATLGAERLAHITIPESVRRLVVLPDRDRSGRLGAAKAMQAYKRYGRDVTMRWPPAGANDWNDVLRAARSSRSFA